MQEDDWVGLGESPLVIDRNVTISGNPELVTSGDLPVFNVSFVKEKLRLEGGVTLNLTGFIMTWYREDLPSSTPGMDLLSNSVNVTGRPAPVLVWYKMALHNRLCFSAAWAAKSRTATARPEDIPGTQNSTLNLPQPGCRNESTGPWLTRCYPVRRKYIDGGAYGAAYSELTGKFERTGYLVHALETDLLCADVMSDACIEQYGSPLGCFYSVFRKTKQLSAPPSPPLLPQQAPSSASDSGGGGDAAGRRRRTVLIAFLCSVLGLAAISIVAAITLLVRSSRRRLPRWPADDGAAGSDVQTAGGSRKPGGKDAAAVGGGRKLDDSAGLSSDTGEQQHHQQQTTISLDLMAPGGAGPLLALGLGREQPKPVLPSPPSSVDGREVKGEERGRWLSGGATVEDAYQQHQQRQPRRYPLTAAAPDDVPVTLQTPPRPDMHLLADPFRPTVDNEVKLLPNATRGAGSFGRVVEGEFKGQRVAVKLVADAYQWGGPSEALLRSFAQEVEVLCRCAHPNVVRLLAACLTPPRVCLVMELMETSLERVMYPLPRKPALLPLTTVLHVALEVAKGLEYLHPTIVHRDLKPGNVLINDRDSLRPVVKLTDFGLSRLRSTDVPTRNPEAGTPAYLAPEGLDPMNHVITHKADIYSLAIMLWEMVAGERPWRDYNVMEMAIRVVLQGSRPPLEQMDEARCPPKLRQLIARCWDGDPRRRPAAAEVAKSLALIMQEVESDGGNSGGGGGSASSGGGGGSSGGCGCSGCRGRARGQGDRCGCGGGRGGGDVDVGGNDGLASADGGSGPYPGSGVGSEGGGATDIPAAAAAAARVLGRQGAPNLEASTIAEAVGHVSPEEYQAAGAGTGGAPASASVMKAARPDRGDRGDGGGALGAKAVAVRTAVVNKCRLAGQHQHQQRHPGGLPSARPAATGCGLFGPGYGGSASTHYSGPEAATLGFLGSSAFASSVLFGGSAAHGAPALGGAAGQEGDGA